MRAKTISVTGNSPCAMRSTLAGSMARACNRRVTLFRSLAGMATRRISLPPTRNCRAARTLPTTWTMSRKRSGATSSMAHGTMLDDEGAALMAKKGTWLVPTLYTFQHGIELGTTHGQDPITLAKEKEIIAHQQPAFTRALQAHLKIAVGIDDEPQYLPKEVEALVSGGMTPLQALQAATINGAALLNWSDRIGTIEPGKFADIIAIDGDPVQDINAIEKVVFVMKDGVTFKNDLAPKPPL